MKGSHVLFVGLLALSLGGWSFLGFGSYSWNQKMTVEVEIDGQLYAGSSVVEVSTTRHPDWLPVEGSYDSEMRGEAVVLELPEQRYLFALIKDAINLAPKVFEDRLDGALSESSARWAEILEDVRETRDINPKDYPLLVTFTDITDPKTVQEVDPENLAATFGPGVSLKRISLEITEEDVTEGQIERVFEWFLEVDSLTPREEQPRLAKDQTPEQKIGLLDFMDWKTFREKRAHKN